MCVAVVIVGDNFVEDTKMFNLNIVPVNPLDSEYSGELSASITVVDDDGKCIGIA